MRSPKNDLKKKWRARSSDSDGSKSNGAKVKVNEPFTLSLQRKDK